MTIKDVLADVAQLAADLRQICPLNLTHDEAGGVSRTAAHLHLLHHQVGVYRHVHWRPKKLSTDLH